MHALKTILILIVRDARFQAALGGAFAIALEIASRFAESPDGRSVLGSVAVLVALLTPLTEAIKRLFGGAAQTPGVGPGGPAAGK